MNTDTECEVSRLTSFMRRHYEPARGWPADSLTTWVEWAASEEFLGVVLNDKHSPVGLGIARPVMKAEDAVGDINAFDQEGSCIFIDVAIATVPEAFLALSCILRRRFGVRDTIAFQRLPNPRIHVFPYSISERVLRKASKEIYGKS